MLDMVTNVGNDVELPTKDISSILVSVCKKNDRALILAHTLPPQCVQRRKYYATKRVYFCEEIQPQRVKLLVVDTRQ